MLRDFLPPSMTDSDDRERTETGEYVETVSESEVLDALIDADDPVLTVGEVAESIDTSPDTARRRLQSLHESGDVHRKEVGARAVVWWPPHGDP